MKKIALIGSTGSIGRQVLSVVKRHSDKFKIVSLAAGENLPLLLEQVKEFSPKVATAKTETDVSSFKGTEFFFGEDAFKNAIIGEADVIVVSLVGFKGIIAVLDAIDKGKDIALANKESLVVGGDIVMRRAKEKGIKIVPIDSEHSAIFQALNFNYETPFRRIILTASGGAFRDLSLSELKSVNKDQALKHPTWQMGAKITIDCATLVNKAFEVIEAKWLYNAPFDKIDVIIHKESIIHSMVEFNDGEIIAQLSYPSMELPIALALSYPERIEGNVSGIDFKTLSSLSFSELDKKRFPCFDLVVEAGKKGGIYPAVCNGANEQAVSLFLQNKIKYFDIYESIDGALSSCDLSYSGTPEDLTRANEFAVNYVRSKFNIK